MTNFACQLPQCFPPRLARSSFLAIAAVLVLLATATGLDAQVAGQVSEGGACEESEVGALMVEHVKAVFAEGRYEKAVEDLRHLRSISTSAVSPQTHQGVRLLLRSVVHSWNDAQRQQYERLIGGESRNALKAAGDRLPALERVFIDFPGSEAGRQACLRLGSTALEAGDLVRAAAWLRLYLDDTQTPTAARPKVAVMLVLALAMQGRQVEAAALLDESLKKVQDDPADYWGTRCTAREMSQRILQWSRVLPPSWPQVGGQATRCNVTPADVRVEECLALGGQSLAAGFDVPADGVVAQDKPGNAVNDSGQKFPAEEASVTSQRYLVATYQDHLSVHDRRTHALLWRQPIVGPGLENQVGLWPSCDERVVVMVEPRLRRPVEPRLVAMRLELGTYWGTVRNVVTAHDLKTGRLVWQWEGRPLKNAPLQGKGGDDKGERGPDPAVPAVGDQAGDAPPEESQKQGDESAAIGLEEGMEPAGPPLLHGECVYVPVARAPKMVEDSVTEIVECFVACLDAATGRPLWVQYIGSLTTMATTLAPEHFGVSTQGRWLYLNAGRGLVAALELSTREVAWVAVLPPVANRNPWERRKRMMVAPILCGDYIVVRDWRGKSTLRGLSAADGKVLWQQVVPTEANLCLQGAADGRVLVTAGDKAWAYDVSTGKQRFEASLPAPVTGRGFMSSDAAIVPTAAGLVRLDAAGKATVFRASASGEPPSVQAIPLN